MQFSFLFLNLFVAQRPPGDRILQFKCNRAGEGVNKIYAMSKSIHMYENEIKTVWQITIKGVQAVARIKPYTHCQLSMIILLIACYLAKKKKSSPAL